MRWRFGRFAIDFHFWGDTFFAHLSWKLVSFSDRLLSVVCLSVRPSFCKPFTFSSPSPEPLNLLLKNHWAYFNQTWHKASLGEGHSNLFKRRAHSFPNADNYEIHWQILKNLHLQNHWANQTWHKAFLGELDSSLFKLRRRDINEVAKIHWLNLKIFFSRTTHPISTKLSTIHPWVREV